MRTVIESYQNPPSNLISDELIGKLFDDDFVSSVQQEIEKLSPICDFIDFAQRILHTTLSEALDKWLSLPVIEGHHKAWLRRDAMMCKLPVLIAYTLHPKFKGEKLPSILKKQVNVTIYNNGKGEKAFSDLKKFLKGEAQYGDKDALNLNPEDYWELMQPFCEELSAIALKYSSLPSSTAPLERVFSMWSYVHSKSRNRLSAATSEKLLFIYHYYKTL